MNNRLVGDEDGNMLPDEQPKNTELEPLKKYLLLQKLEKLRTRLEKNKIESSGLETLLKFGNNFSYETILSLSNAFVTFLEKQLPQDSKEVNDAE